MFPIVKSAATAALLASTAQALWINTTSHPNGYISYSTETGYFLQDKLSTNETTFNYTQTNFGLINRTYPADPASGGNLTQWQRFERQVNALNQNAPLNTIYKVLFMGRHAEGYHNAAESYYGTPAWNCYWAELNGNATASWFDARLTPAGIESAQVAHDFWVHEHETQHIPYPQSYYTSPLTRCLQTANITFSGIATPPNSPFVPTVKEFLREGISVHTCDRRGTRSYIEASYPDWNIEATLPEYDELWTGVIGESGDAQNTRSKIVLDDLFSSDGNTWLSITSHSGEIRSMLSVLGHREFSLATGAVIPVLVKAQFLDAEAAPSSTWAPWTTTATCNSPPVTSISTLSQGCVCPTASGVSSAVSSASAYATAR